MAASFTSWLRIMNWVEMAQEQVWEKREEEGRNCFFFKVYTFQFTFESLVT